MTGHQNKIVKSFNIEDKLAFQKLGSKERKDMFTIDDSFRLKVNLFVLCLFLTSKNAPMERWFDRGAHDRREII